LTQPDRDHYVADCTIAVEQARRASGCLDFALTADPVDPARVNVYERWKFDPEPANFRGSGPDAANASAHRARRGAQVPDLIDRGAVTDRCPCSSAPAVLPS
jgi:hypothetical protein